MVDSAQWLRECNGFLIDLDGTLYRGREAIPQAKEFVERLRESGKRYLFVTNNSALLPNQVADKLQKMGIPAVTEHIFTSSQATAMFMREHAKHATPTYYAIGEAGLHAALQAAGYQPDDEQPDYVVVGIDREFTYKKLMTASLAIQKGAVFLATNADKRVPTDKGLVPGAGSLNRAVATASGVEPIWIGKPEARMIHYSMQKIGTLPEKTVVVGDNLETDILAGANAGARTVLVLTGYSKREDVAQAEAKPDVIMRDLAEVLKVLTQRDAVR